MKVIIVGVGKLGYRLAETLVNVDIDVTLLDQNEKVLEGINNYLDVLTVCANGIEIEALKEINIKSYDLLVATTNSDESNALICTLAKKLGCKKTIARIRNPEYTKQVEFIKLELGIDHIINPDLATSNEIARYLLKSYNFYSEDFAKGKVAIVDFSINHIPELIGKKIMEQNILENLLIISIFREGNLIIPHGNTELKEDDIINVIGSQEAINKLSERFNFISPRSKIKKVMILGGGNIAFYLAQKLKHSHVDVSIIEQDMERCTYLSEKLTDALIIQGDGTDINILEEEGLNSMDAFIGATGFDEQNLLMSLIAKRAGVKKTIAKVSRSNYVKIIDNLGVDISLNPINIAISSILKFIRGGKVVSVSLLLGGEAEVIEMIALKNSKIIGKPLYQMGLPKGIIIGAIVHAGKVLIPNGNTIISPNDRLIIFCLSSDVPKLEEFTNPMKGGLFR
ncbi:MAG TPA: Trk system potassium transporter TrkA [Defluviitaleaceae bacterium]|jgi:trk system potassium uptake protein TrkA|nr:Trk system potassium transporter TrkA [Candidatus Epulonipiscium sp.]HOA79923.1 Trk system potassium transporter TrkA [Defluviitaleaceae bacterium]